MIGVVIAIPVFLMGGKPAANKTETKSDAQNQKPDIITMPQQSPAPQTSSQPIPASNASTLPAGQPGDLVPVDPKLKEDKTGTTGQKPAAPKKEAPAAKPKAPAAKPGRAEKLLTGN